VDSGFVVRPAGQTSSAAGRKSAVRDAVPVSLSAAQSVTAVAKPAEAHTEANSALCAAVDAQSQQVITQALDAARQQVEQPPEETKQRLRAYVRRPSGRGGAKGALDLEV
jgi:hypothetical protein